MMRVLVTGGAGYIGSCTAARLACAGFEPVVLDNLSTGHADNVRWGPLVQGDLADRDVVRKTIRDFNVQAAIHFAANAYVGESMSNPRKYFRTNVAGSLNLFDALLDEQVLHVIFSSTCATYGVPESVPITEDHSQRPVNPYGESKLFVERALRWYGEAYGLRWMALRYFNAAGADEEHGLGEAHQPETHLIPLAIEAALGHRRYLDVYGTDYPTPDGTAVRDYIHVVDLAEAHVAALSYVLRADQSGALNLGTGHGYSVREVISAVSHVSKLKVDVRPAARRAGDPPVLVADSRRAGELLGWHPRRTSLEEIAGSAWRWHAARYRGNGHPTGCSPALLH